LNKNLINVDYFKRGLKINILQVSSSLIIGFTTSIVYFSNLSGRDFVIYSLIQLTVYFFVNFSSLELNQYIRKFVPIMEKRKSILFLSLILKTVSKFFFFGILIYFFVARYTNLYENFNESKLLIFFSVFLLSLIQLFARMLPEYVSANKKFDLIEKKYLFFLTPYKIVALIIFYFFSSTLITAIVINLFLRILQLVLVLTIFEDLKLLTKTFFSKQEKIEEFNITKNLKFTVKNFLYVNFPLLFFSIIPTYLSGNYNLDDVAVFTLVLTLFNAIKPVLYAISTILNPTIVNLKSIKKIAELKITIKTSINILILLHFTGILIIWLSLNFNGFTDFFLQFFSYNLFSDFINSIMVVSLFFVLTMLQQSYFLASNYETKFFYSSLISTIASILFLIIYIYFDLKINFILGVVVVFYCFKYFFSMIFIRNEAGFPIWSPVAILLFFPVSLLTYTFDSLVIYVFLFISISIISLLLINKNYKNLNLEASS
tara:strand:+ start:32293 stop:33753 length:1461 start_codon:yes stop_codon:yes gene_type:complete